MSSVKRNLYSVHINNLPVGTKEEDLLEIFNEAGQVRDHYVEPSPPIGKYTFGFMRYATKEECQEAISLFHGWKFKGQDLKVSMAKHQPADRDAKLRQQRQSKNTCLDQERIKQINNVLIRRKLISDMPLLMKELRSVPYELFPMQTYPRADFSLNIGLIESLLEARKTEETVFKSNSIHSLCDSADKFNQVLKRDFPADAVTHEVSDSQSTGSTENADNLGAFTHTSAFNSESDSNDEGRLKANPFGEIGTFGPVKDPHLNERDSNSISVSHNADDTSDLTASPHQFAQQFSDNMLQSISSTDSDWEKFDTSSTPSQSSFGRLSVTFGSETERDNSLQSHTHSSGQTGGAFDQYNSSSSCSDQAEHEATGLKTERGRYVNLIGQERCHDLPRDLSFKQGESSKLSSSDTHRAENVRMVGKGRGRGLLSLMQTDS